jgi:hypothetical protein
VRCGDVEDAFGGATTVLKDVAVEICQLPLQLLHVLLFPLPLVM